MRVLNVAVAAQVCVVREDNLVLLMADDHLHVVMACLLQGIEKDATNFYLA